MIGPVCSVQPSRCEPRGQAVPDPVVGPVVQGGVVGHLQVEPRHRRRAHRVQGEALRVPGVDQLVGRRRHVGEDAEPGVGVGPLPRLRVRHGAARGPERAITADHDIGPQPHLRAVLGSEGDRRRVRLEVVQRGVGDLVVHDLPALVGGGHQVLLHLGLPVDPHRASGQVHEVQMVPLARPLEVDAAVLVTLALEALAEADLPQQVHGGLLEDAGPDPRRDVLLRPGLHDDRLDALAVEQVREQHPGRPGPDDGDLGALLLHGTSQPRSGRGRTCPTSAGRKRRIQRDLRSAPVRHRAARLEPT